MEKDIEKLLDNMVVPEMEYVKTKNAVAVPEVPEVVLPKTKAEMYREAKAGSTKNRARVRRVRPKKKQRRKKAKGGAQAGYRSERKRRYAQIGNARNAQKAHREFA